MEHIIIRRAVREDCPRLLELVQELATYEKAPDEVTLTLQHFTESGFGTHPIWWAFVAVLPSQDGSEKVVGFALYYIRFSTWKGQRMYLEDLIVTDEVRGKGIGMRLMEALKQEAKEKGYNAIVWQVLDWNEPAINFYKKFDASFDSEWVNCCISC